MTEFVTHETLARLLDSLALDRANSRTAFRSVEVLTARVGLLEGALASALTLAHLLPPERRAQLSERVERQFQMSSNTLADKPDAMVDAALSASADLFRTALKKDGSS